jgi:PPK2 family polyphosphate:nucleotide phosphotransferase
MILQATDAAGKDGTIEHVTRGLNPQGCHVRSFKAPSSEELDHDYLWRVNRKLPERGTIGIFNRSHYEEVLVAKIHNLPFKQQLPEETVKEDVWKKRYRQINDYEKYLHENGIVIIKIFLHLSKDEQKKRILARIDDPAKNWKFSAGDLDERKYWDAYQKAFEDMIRYTATAYAPWYVVPADRKWFARTLVSEILLKTLEKIDPKYPSLPEDQQILLSHYREILEAE